MGKKVNIIFSLLFAVIFTMVARENNTHLYQIGHAVAVASNGHITSANSPEKFVTKRKVPANIKYIIRAKAITNWDVDNPTALWLPQKLVFYYYNVYNSYYSDCLLNNAPSAKSLRGPPGIAV